MTWGQADGNYYCDHYKWRVMRSNGVKEDYITGDKLAFETVFEIHRILGNGNR